MAWIKTQEGDLQAIGSMIIAYRNGNSIYCGTNFLGSYKNHEAAIQVREDFHRWLDRHGHGVFTMPPKDFMKPFFGPIDVEKAAESILKSCRSVGPVVVHCPLCGREGWNVEGICPKCGADGGFKSYMAAATKDVTVFPGHDASKPIGCVHCPICEFMGHSPLVAKPRRDEIKTAYLAPCHDLLDARGGIDIVDWTVYPDCSSVVRYRGSKESS